MGLWLPALPVKTNKKLRSLLRRLLCLKSLQMCMKIYIIMRCLLKTSQSLAMSYNYHQANKATKLQLHQPKPQCFQPWRSRWLTAATITMLSWCSSCLMIRLRLVGALSTHEEPMMSFSRPISHFRFWSIMETQRSGNWTKIWGRMLSKKVQLMATSSPWKSSICKKYVFSENA